MSSELLRGLKARQGKGLLRLLQIGTAALGILAADAGPKPVHAALPEYKAVPMPQLEPGFPTIQEMQRSHFENALKEATQIRDAIVAMRERFKSEAVKLQPRLNALLKGVIGVGSPEQEISALVATAKKELARLDAALDTRPNAREVRTLASRISKSYDALQKFFLELDFSEESLTGGGYADGPTRLRDAEYRTEAQKALDEAEELFKSDADDLSAAFYRAVLLTLQTLQQTPQPAQPEPRQ